MRKKIFKTLLIVGVLALLMSVTAFAEEEITTDMWTLAKSLITKVYTQILGISTVLAGLMSAVAVIGAKMSGNQQKVDRSWDWLKRIWLAWAIINGIGGFISFIDPIFTDYHMNTETEKTALNFLLNAHLL